MSLDRRDLTWLVVIGEIQAADGDDDHRDCKPESSTSESCPRVALHLIHAHTVRGRAVDGDAGG
jgi:hypothetical protein